MNCLKCSSTKIQEGMGDPGWFPGKEYVRGDNDCPSLVETYFCDDCGWQWSKYPTTTSSSSGPTAGGVAKTVLAGAIAVPAMIGGVVLAAPFLFFMGVGEVATRLAKMARKI